MEIDTGTLLAQRYRVQRPLGRGGMGEVFAAENVRTGRICAVKVLRADSKQKSSAAERFRREARAAGSINSDYVTQVLDVEDDPEHGIVLVFELLEGESLIDRLKRTGPMSFAELFPVVEQVLMGLADAHRAGIIHRDLKPSNVFLERRPDGSSRVKILDFGISKLPKEVAGDTLTEMGQSLGTFSFMPPEQIGKAKTVDHRADIYATGTLIFQSLSGQLPYAAKNILHMVELKSKSEPRPLGSVVDGGVDPALEAFLTRSLAREPSDRFSTAAEALDAWRALRNAYVGTVGASPAAPAREQATAADGGRSRAPNPQMGATLPSMTSGSSSMSMSGAMPAAHAPVPAAHTAVPSAQFAVHYANAPSTHGSMAAAPYPAPGGPAVSVRSPGLSGTVMMHSSGGPNPAVRIAVPNVAPDTTSEGGDGSSTVAMPLRQATGGRTLASVPRLHDDQPDQAGQGTHLMPHAGRTTGPQATGPQPTQSTPYSVPAAALRTGGYANPAAMAFSNPEAQPASGEDGLTTVYRRDAELTARGQGQAPPSVRPGSGSIGLFVGELEFALVGFALAAIALSYAQTGRWLWQ